MRPATRWTLPLLAIGGVLPAMAMAAEDPLVTELRRQLAERDAEIAALHQQMAALRSQLPGQAAPPAGREDPAHSPPSANAAGDDELLGALESSLVRQGAGVLARGVIEMEPEFDYQYDEPIEGQRRDTFGLALTTRYGLTDSLQAELQLPYVVRDDISGQRHSSGWGDARLGLTAELQRQRETGLGLLAFVQWRTTTGDIDRSPPTGFGQDALQVGLSVTRRQDPVVLFGSLSYTANIGSAHLHNGSRLDSGDIFGGRLGAYLAATPDTSFYLGVAFNSSTADRFNGQRIDTSDRLRAMVELGTTTTVGYGKFLNVSAGFGVTPAAPKFSLSTSIPIRF